jgi:ribosomal protein S18 acetylase RimI-like enzyme
MGEPHAARSLSVRVAVFDGVEAVRMLDAVRPIYADVYAEPPYGETAADVDDFARDWPRRASQPGFRLAVAYDGDQPIGFSFGHRLPADTAWWSGVLDDVPSDLIAERPGRTFAVIELAVRPEHRRRGVARRLHDALLAGRSEERVTLLCRPEAEPAQRAYSAWGYLRVARIRPFAGAPVYDAMLRSLGR